jgi:hypothetical protein
MRKETCECPKGKRIFYEDAGDFIHETCGLSMRQDLLDAYLAPTEGN